MKLLRAGAGILAGLAASYFMAAEITNSPDYASIVNRFFLIGVPAAGTAFLLFISFPAFMGWIRRVLADYSILHYCLGFIFSLGLTYAAVGFLSEPIRTSSGMVAFTALGITIGTVSGYYLVRRADRSVRGGFLSRPLNLLLALVLPLFLSAIIYVCMQFPSMFIREYLTVPKNWEVLFVATSLAAGLWSLRILELFHSSGFRERLEQTDFFRFISQNIPGLYAGGMFFLINLILARSLNHPALSYNSVLFESDAGPWMDILANPEIGEGLRSVHPLSLIIIRPLIRLVAVFMGENWNLAGMLVVSAVSGLSVFMTWLFIRRAARARTHAFIFASLLGASAAHLVFGSLTENYIFGEAALIFFFLLLQARESRLSVLLPAGLLLFGITISNIAQGLVVLFFNEFGLRRLVRYGALVLGAGVILTLFTGTLYPDRQRYFFVPANIAYEFNFVRVDSAPLAEHLLEKIQVVSRTVFLYSVVGPSPLEAISDKPPYDTIDIQTFDARTHRLASYKGYADIALLFWLLLLGGAILAFVINIKSFENLHLMLGSLGSLGFNFLLHMVYGTELFLYSLYWVYALVFFISLAFAKVTKRKWLETMFSVVLIAIMANNIGFIFALLRGLAPFYAAV